MTSYVYFMNREMVFRKRVWFIYIFTHVDI
jgi:hypothetical protein